MRQQIETAIADIARRLYGFEDRVDLSRPDEQFGDYATNVALHLAKPAGKNPREVADIVAEELRVKLAGIVSDISIAGPGFINLRLNDKALATLAGQGVTQAFAGETIVTEYSDMNPFKQAHVGHLYTTIVGDVISRLYEVSGAKVSRTNFGGDVGLHVAKTMWGIVKFLDGENPDGLVVQADSKERMAWISARYVEGNRAYELEESAKQDIIDINRRVYDIHAQNDHESPFAVIYWICRGWSYDFFKEFYDELQVNQFEKYYPESMTAPEGVKTVREQLERGVYEVSDGAVIFDGERYGLHTRVFINSNGLPTYETKDVGLSMLKWSDYKFDQSVIITGSDITEYMKVVIKSIEQFEPELAHRTLHITHGNVKLAGGVKMSSRLGNGLVPDDVLNAARAANREATGKDDEGVVLGAVKYAFLRSRIGADLIYDAAESVSLQGNSGPYLQYAHARARSIIKKAETAESVSVESEIGDLEADERSLLRKISEYPEAVDKAVADLMPHHVCTYLYELAQSFNRFYENNLVVGDPRQVVRLKLVGQYADTLKDGLWLLGISAPDRM